MFVGAAAARQLTRFTSERIFRFAYSRDATKIAFERGIGCGAAAQGFALKTQPKKI